LLNAIRLLERIQKIDLEIKAIEDEQRSFNGNIEKLSLEIKGAEAAIQALSAETESLAAERRAAEEKIRESSEKIAKDESRVGAIKNSKELNALTKEISAANKARKQSEQEKTALDSRIDEKRGVLSAREGELRELSGNLKRLMDEMEGKKAEWTGDTGKKQEQRNSLAAELPQVVVKKYENIRLKRGGLGIALVKDETCQGCYIHIPPQVYIQLRRGVEELLTCPHCHRILYVEAESRTEAV
jgi:uncharacterized protein